MRVLLFDVFNGYAKECQTHWENLTFSKLVGKVNFPEKKIEEMR